MCICNKIFEIVIFIILLKQGNRDIDVYHDTESSCSFLKRQNVAVGNLSER